MLEAVIEIVPEGERDGYDSLWSSRIGLRLEEMRGKPAAARRIAAPGQTNIHHESQAPYIFRVQAQLMAIEIEHVINRIGMHACRDMISPRGEGQIAAGDAPPHVDGQVIADLVAESIGCGGINIGQARKR